jgi:hypothetical protein
MRCAFLVGITGQQTRSQEENPGLLRMATAAKSQKWKFSSRHNRDLAGEELGMADPTPITR